LYPAKEKMKKHPLLLTSSYYYSVVLLLLLLLTTTTTTFSSSSQPPTTKSSTKSINGVFNFPRANTCYGVTASVITSSIPITELPPSNSCIRYSLKELHDETIEYVQFFFTELPQQFRAVRLGAVSAFGSIDDGKTKLSYTCPPINFNGFKPVTEDDECAVAPQTQLLLVHLDADTKNIVEINIITSFEPFPTITTLPYTKRNKPPFGMAKFIFFGGGIDFPIGNNNNGDNQILEICQVSQPTSSFKKLIKQTCVHVPKDTLKLNSNTAHGYYQVLSSQIKLPSRWILYLSGKQIIHSFGDDVFYYNETGYHFYDSTTKKCTWSTLCNFYCRVIKFDTRFMDLAGEWTITRKLGIQLQDPQVVKAWIGNSVDGAGNFPAISYTSTRKLFTGYDRLDTIPQKFPGSSVWYPNTQPYEDGDIESFHPNLIENKCV
jgi:hypothetical protein